MKRKAPTRQDRTPKEPDAQKRPFFSQDQTGLFFSSSGVDAFFQPPKKQSSQGQSVNKTVSSSTPPAPYHISFTNVAPPAQPDHSKANPGPPGNAANRAGYTHMRYNPSLNVSWNHVPVRNAQGQAGLFVEAANVGFHVIVLTVAISSKYARGSCPYRVTYAHEYRHVRNFLNIFRSHRSTMVKKVQGIPLPTAKSPRYVDPAQASAAQAQIVAPLVQAIKDVKGQIKTDINADRSSMDSSSSYAKEYAQCPRSAW